MSVAEQHVGKPAVSLKDADFNWEDPLDLESELSEEERMVRVLPYGATKSALESMSAIWAAELEDAGITVNVLIPGGPTDTPFIADGAGWDRAKMLKPEIMGPPACWLVSDDAANYTGQRIIAANWDASLPGMQAAAKAGRAIGWPELGADAVWLTS